MEAKAQIIHTHKHLYTHTHTHTHTLTNEKNVETKKGNKIKKLKSRRLQNIRINNVDT